MRKFILLFIAINLAFFITGCGEQNSNSESNSGVGTEGINKQEFDKVTFDMYWWNVQDVIGTYDVGETISEEESTNNLGISTSTKKVKYYGEKSGYAIFTFTDDKVTKKEQVDLS